MSFPKTKDHCFPLRLNRNIKNKQDSEIKSNAYFAAFELFRINEKNKIIDRVENRLQTITIVILFLKSTKFYKKMVITSIPILPI